MHSWLKTCVVHTHVLQLNTTMLYAFKGGAFDRMLPHKPLIWTVVSLRRCMLYKTRRYQCDLIVIYILVQIHIVLCCRLLVDLQ